ncbi:MAG: DUF1592 domain-containing protein [Rhodospirillaceae bacterium]|nr:DUF1592 domain-containing protein [Rhodospirillaceae bacterium]
MNVFRHTRALIRPMALSLAALLTLSACDNGPATTGGPTTVRRLTESQYRHIITDVFGPHIVVAGRFDPLIRTEGLLAVGASQATISPAAVERYAALAKSIAQQVVDEKNRALILPCAPVSPAKPDEVCAKTFFTKVGRYLYRRPLADDEIGVYTKIAANAGASRGSFYDGVSYGLQAMLQSPDFLFVTENAVANSKTKALQQLDDYSKASRLSFFLWNTSPDDELLAAAEKGELSTSSGLRKQVDRMMNATRFEGGVRAFFSDMLALDDFATLEKDTLIYPAFSLAAAEDGKEQLLRTLVDVLLVKDRDYRELFTTRETFMTSALGLVYRLPATNPGGWAKFTFAEDDQRAGIQGLLSFTALHSHPGKSSPTLRGKAIRELLLCQKIPDPPSTVNFDQFNDPNSPNRTARDRLTVHATDPACAGCHKLVDPIGLALETFDGAGQTRWTENGAKIDTSGNLNGIPFNDPKGLGQALREDPAAAQCVVRRAYNYATARPLERGERKWLNYLEHEFADDGYRFRELIRKIALSDALYAVSPVPVRSAGTVNEEPRS